MTFAARPMRDDEIVIVRNLAHKLLTIRAPLQHCRPLLKRRLELGVVALSSEVKLHRRSRSNRSVKKLRAISLAYSSDLCASGQLLQDKTVDNASIDLSQTAQRSRMGVRNRLRRGESMEF